MRQIVLNEFGGPDVLRMTTVPDPVPGPGQVLVHTAAAGVTFVETQIRAGRPPWPGPGPQPPLVLGNGVAGEIVAVGEGVDPAQVGRRVVTATGGRGGYAELVTVPAEDPVGVPDGIGMAEAVALFTEGRTALALARSAQIGPQDRVLVLAAAGGVGSLLLQLARSAGAARVVAAAGGERKLAVCRELGADQVVDYSEPGWPELVGAVDVVYDGVGGRLGDDASALLGAGGRLVAYGAASGTFPDSSAAATRGITVVAGNRLLGSPEDNQTLSQEALALAAAGLLRPLVGQTYPLSRACDAHAAIETRQTIGKTVLLPDAITLGEAELGDSGDGVSTPMQIVGNIAAQAR